MNLRFIILLSLLATLLSGYSEAQEVVRYTYPMPAERLKAIVAADGSLSKLSEAFRLKGEMLITEEDTFWVVKQYPVDFRAYEYDSDSLDLRIYGGRRGETFLMSTSETSPGYHHDTLIDADFDGHLDFVVTYYSGVGCCPRDYHDVYLYRDGTFRHKPQSTFNANYNDDCRCVTEMSYGHAPYISLTRSVWDSDTLKIIETVDFDMTQTDSSMYISGKYVIVDKETGQEETVDSLPSPYSDHDIVNMWFRVEEREME